MIEASTIPAGVHVELSRARTHPGVDDTVDEWMTMLNDRVDECVATLSTERMALEIVFRHIDDHGDGWLYWVSIQGADGGGHDMSNAIDVDHVAYGKRVKGPGWEELTPQFLLAPDHIRNSIVAWATQGLIA